MITKFLSLTLLAFALMPLMARADDLAWGSTTGSSIVEIDATTGTLVSLTFNGAAYTNFKLLAVPTGTMNGRPNNVALGSSLWIAQNSNGTLYGLDNGGTLYTITTTLSTDQNGDIGFVATKVNVNSLGLNVTGAVFISSNLLDVSTSQGLYQYNLSANTTTNLGSFPNNANMTGLAYNGTLYGVVFSPSPGAIYSIAGVNITRLTNSSINGLSGGSSAFAGASLLYVSDGNSSFYSYNTGTNTLTTIVNSFGSGIHSLTPLSVAGGGTATPTPTPTPTPTATPTPTPTPTATPKITYSTPTGTLTISAPETTPQGYPECAPAYTYSAAESSTFGSNPTIDTTGTLGIYRYYQTTTDGVNYLPTTALAASPASTVWAWASGSTNTHAAISYTAGQVGTTGTPFYYGRETLTLVYSSPKNGTNTVLDTKTIYQYPWNNISGQTIKPTALFSNAITSAAAGGNPSPYASPFPTPSPSLLFQGDTPRFTVQLNNLYPAGTSSVIIYTGTPVTNPTASGYQTIAITAAATPNSGLWTTAPAITFEVAPPYISTATTTAQTYTIAAVQTLPAGYATSTTTAPLNPAVLNTLTFTTTSGFNVNGTVGTVK